MIDRLIYILIILGIINIALLVININVTERSIKSKVDEKLKKLEEIEKELSSVKQLMALMAFCEMDEKDQCDFINDIKKEVSKYDDKRDRTE
mgnify:FL=1